MLYLKNNLNKNHYKNLLKENKFKRTGRIGDTERNRNDREKEKEMERNSINGCIKWNRNKKIYDWKILGWKFSLLLI